MEPCHLVPFLPYLRRSSKGSGVVDNGPPSQAGAGDHKDAQVRARRQAAVQVEISIGVRLVVGEVGFVQVPGAHGHQAQLELLAESPSGHFRIGGEFVHRQFDTRVFDVKGVEVNSYSFDLLMHYVLNPGGLTPYLGAGIGLQANDLSKRDLKRASSALDVRDDVGLGYGLFGLLGLELPISRDAVLFAEGRLNLAYQITGRNGARVYADYYKDGVDKTAVEDLGGGSGVFGLRVRF